MLQQGKNLASKAASGVYKDVLRERDKAFQRPTGVANKRDDPVDGAVRVAASVVGFVSEVVQYRKDKKEPRPEASRSAQDPERPKNATTPEDINQAIWHLDAAVEESGPTQTGPSREASVGGLNRPTKEPGDLVKAFIMRHPYHPHPGGNTPIALPVVLPQRRPKTRARGFVRAYSPVLAAAGIDQETFLDFIDTLNKALEPNPYLFALNLAGLAGLASPEPFSLFIGAAVGFATDLTMEAQSRHKSSKFIDRINAEFFIPRGLVCLIVTWSPDATGDDQLLKKVGFDGQPVDAPPQTGLVQQVRDLMAKKTTSDQMMGRFQGQFQDRMKANSGAFQSAEPAPLVFPSPEQTIAALSTRSNGGRKNAVDRGEIWLDDFMDRRAQAKWIQKNPEFNVASSLPAPDFRSRYSDPNHPAASGDLVAFVTGGRWTSGTKTKEDARSKGKQKEEEKTTTAQDRDGVPSRSGTQTADNRGDPPPYEWEPGRRPDPNDSKGSASTSGVRPVNAVADSDPSSPRDAAGATKEKIPENETEKERKKREEKEREREKKRREKEKEEEKKKEKERRRKEKEDEKEREKDKRRKEKEEERQREKEKEREKEEEKKKKKEKEKSSGGGFMTLLQKVRRLTTSPPLPCISSS
ncbi:hypothetical protein AAL_02454 [Moelleriella libera RCEF 2490]|uniref:Uncharacterized protein n=1 Tax=Moelleriella libera RCEF 2490 TaxID=1081109 RepID=A0A168EKQ9_9HYPO|nr:hypothetical protein AAL_02454 [Moelleriella libera RCEF 2490]